MDHHVAFAKEDSKLGIEASACQRRGLIEHTRQQHQGIAQGLDVVGLDPAVGHAAWLSMSWLRQTASQFAGRPGDLGSTRIATSKTRFKSPFISAQDAVARRDAWLRQGVTSRSETWSVGTDRLRQAKPLKRSCPPPGSPLDPGSRCLGGIKRGTWGRTPPFQRLSLTQPLAS